MKHKIRSYTYGILSILLLIGLDQYTKWLATEYLKNQASITLLPGVFKLHYLENKGAAFGLLQGGFPIFIAGAIIVTILVLWLYGRMPINRRFLPLRMCGVLLVAGAIGNMIDRFVHGFVIDFFYFYLINFPIFNVADVYVVLSCISIAILILFIYKEHELDMVFPSFNKKPLTTDQHNVNSEDTNTLK